MRIWLTILFIVLVCGPAGVHPCAAQDSLIAPRPSIVKKRFEPDAKRAGLLSAIIPGMGQMYNRQYWKVPVIYAGVATAVYFIVENNNQYNRYRKAYVSRLGNDPNAKDEFTGILSTEAVKQYQDSYKKYLDMTVLFTVIGYAGQVMEAITAAHLRNFDVSQDISLQVKPVMIPNGTVGIGIAMNFR